MAKINFIEHNGKEHIVDAKWIGVVGRPGEQEESMLDMNPEREVNSRLSCQIRVRDELDGLIVKLPQFQI